MSTLRSLPWSVRLGLGSLAALALVTFFTLGSPQAPVIDAIGFQDDTSEPCLGASDPSWNCSGEGGGAGGGVSCYICRIVSSGGRATSVTCKEDDAGKGSSCTGHLENGEGWCNITQPAGC